MFLYVEGAVSRRTIRTEGGAVGGRVKVIEGLSGNERVVLSPPADLRDGDEVRIQEQT